MLETSVVEAPTPAVDSSEIWIEALPARVYQTPQYGEVPVTLDKLERMVKNFKDNVRGQEVATDFDHGMDRAKGNKASGWYRDFEIRPSSDDPTQMSLFAKIEPTPEAKTEIVNKEWRYFSLEWDDSWMDNEGNNHQDVITGGAFTNRPIAKKTLPVNFSEALWDSLDDETKKEFAVWSTAFVNNLPDSSFLYVESGGKKDSSGKTTPRSLRHLPYKGTDGKIDLPHLRNAIARIPQMVGVSSSLKTSLQARARKLLGAQSKAMSDNALSEAITLLEGAGLEVLDETKEWEHSEPGTGSPPAPRKDQDGSDDPAIGGGWRRMPLPLPEGDPSAVPPKPPGGMMEFSEEQHKELIKLLGIAEDSTAEQLVEGITKHFGELAEFKKLVDTSTEEKKFAEQFPTMYAEHVAMLDRDRNTSATAFSESVKTVTRTEGDKQITTKQGLSVLAIDKIKEVHKKFAEGRATLADFEAVVSTITHGGLVQYGEQGSSNAGDEPILIDVSTPRGVQAARKMFAEKVAELQQADKLDYKAAIALASERFPELADAYRAILPG